MKMTVTKKIGKKTYKFTLEGNNLHDVVMENEKLSFRSVEECGLCGSNNLYLKAYITKEGYEYTKICCAGCGGSVTFGQRQDNKDQFYLRKSDNGLDWQERVGKNDKNNDKPNSDGALSTPIEEIDSDEEPY